MEPNSIISHYRILSKIGAGGMGEVYLAQDMSELERNVALNILPSEVAKDKERLRRFTQEARPVSNLNHPTFSLFTSLFRLNHSRLSPRNLNPLRDDPRYRDIIRRMGMTGS